MFQPLIKRSTKKLQKHEEIEFNLILEKINCMKKNSYKNT